LKTLVLGLGNPILTDDGVGIHVVREVAARCTRADVAFAEGGVGGLRLLEVITGYERVILVDAISTPAGTPGEIYRLSAGDLRSSLHAGSSHDLSFQGALAWGWAAGMALPDTEHITIVAVEVEDVLTFGETCTVAVAAAIPRAVAIVLELLSQQNDTSTRRQQ
jgi:hydrogenase maturation protease